MIRTEVTRTIPIEVNLFLTECTKVKSLSNEFINDKNNSQLSLDRILANEPNFNVFVNQIENIENELTNLNNKKNVIDEKISTLKLSFIRLKDEFESDYENENESKSIDNDYYNLAKNDFTEIVNLQSQMMTDLYNMEQSLTMKIEKNDEIRSKTIELLVHDDDNDIKNDNDDDDGDDDDDDTQLMKQELSKILNNLTFNNINSRETLESQIKSQLLLILSHIKENKQALLQFLNLKSSIINVFSNNGKENSDSSTSSISLSDMQTECQTLIKQYLQTILAD